MALKEQLQNDLQDAIRASDEVRKTTIRSVLTAIKNAEVPQTIEHRILDGESWEIIAEKYGTSPADVAAGYIDENEQSGLDRPPIAGRKVSVVIPQLQLDDEGVIDLVAKQIKQRRDSIDAFTKANRKDLADKEAAEMVVLQAYMPAQMGRDEIEAEVRKAMEETGAATAADKGKLMKVLMPRLSGKAEGREINEVVTQLLK